MELSRFYHGRIFLGVSKRVSKSNRALRKPQNHGTLSAATVRRAKVEGGAKKNTPAIGGDSGKDALHSQRPLEIQRERIVRGPPVPLPTRPRKPSQNSRSSFEPEIGVRGRPNAIQYR